MSAVLKMDTSEMEHLIQQLKACSEALTEDTNTVNKLLSNIDEVWSGSDLQGFLDKVNNSAPVCLELSKALSEFATYLEGVNACYQETQQALIQSFETFR